MTFIDHRIRSYFMRFQYLIDKTLDLKSEVKHFLINRDAIIPNGKYKGRRGQIQAVSMDVEDSRLSVLIRPYRLRGSGEEFLNDHGDARTYWPLNDVQFPDIERPTKDE